jgi:hypothetical protein
MLKNKHISSNIEWLQAINNIENIISKQQIEELETKTLSAMISTLKGKQTIYAWSGGKDSVVLANLCHKLKIYECVCGLYKLEYPQFLIWVAGHRPIGCTIITLCLDLVWLSKNQFMLFPTNSKIDSKWFNLLQIKAQHLFYKQSKANIMLLGRRKLDANFAPTKPYTDKQGVTRFNPMANWTHEELLAYITYFNLKLPPCYGWLDGWKHGTHPWANRTNGTWEEIATIDKNIVIEAAPYIQGAMDYLNR